MNLPVAWTEAIMLSQCKGEISEGMLLFHFNRYTFSLSAEQIQLNYEHRDLI